MALTLAVETRCPGCGSVETVEVDAQGHAAWKGGELIQHVLPSLSDSQRERLKTGLCDACWPAWTRDDEEEGGAL